MTRYAALIVLQVLWSSALVHADERIPTMFVNDREATATDATVTIGVNDSVPPPLTAVAAGPKRPQILPVLYVSLAALQAYDGYTTSAGISRGAVEVNPLMRGIAGHSVALWSVKAASAAGSIWLTEHLWKRNKAAAIVAMVAVNGAMATVAAHNTAALRKLK